MIRNYLLFFLSAALLNYIAAHISAADPWADNVNEYIPGAEIGNDFVNGNPFSNAQAALGEPTRFTSDVDNFGGATTPLQAAFRNDEVVSIGKGGSLTVSFDEPVTDDPRNPFGIDLLIFGNAFLFGSDIFNNDFSFNPNGTFDGAAGEGGLVELSDDGVNFVPMPNLEADGLFPTNGYGDLTDPFPTAAGNVLTDFTKPVDPAFDIVGKTYTQVLAAYDGSGGGAGIDIGALGFSAITHVRISNSIDSTFVPEIDALADVRAIPEPNSCGLLFAGLSASLACLCRRARIGS